MSYFSLKKNKTNMEINVFHSNGSKAMYSNIMDKDPNNLSQVLLDLYFLGFPIMEALELMKKRMNKKDWFGF